MPAKPIAVPGTKPLGLSMNLLRSSNVHSPPLAFMAAEKLNPRPSPLWSPTIPKRLGPTRLGPPFSKVWQAAHFLAAAAPFSTEAVCSSFSIGSDGAAASLGPAASPSAFATMAKPGFSGSLGAKSAPAVKLVTSRMRQVPRMAPRILLSSKESIFRSGSRPEGRLKAGGTAADERQESGFCTAPSAAMRYRFARALATRINARASGQSPSFPACYQPGPDLIPSPDSNDLHPHPGADSRPHGLDAPAGQAAIGHRRPADDRPRPAPGRGRANRPRGGRHRRAGDRGRGEISRRRGCHDPLGSSFR